MISGFGATLVRITRDGTFSSLFCGHDSRRGGETIEGGFERRAVAGGLVHEGFLCFGLGSPSHRRHA